MLNNRNKYEARIYEVATIIKLVTGLNIKSVCNVASNIVKHYNSDDIDKLDNNIIYEAYINEGKI